jgi:histidinol-phosphate aminotransferase
LSKAYSLAGMRFGYAVAQEQVIAEMMKVKDSYNCDAVSIAIATAAIEDQASARQTWQYIRAERRRVTDALTTMGWSVLPSHANFLLVTCPGGRGREVYLGLKQQGILVRYFDKPGLTDKVRITVGQNHENNALLAGIKRLAAGEKAA